MKKTILILTATALLSGCAAGMRTSSTAEVRAIPNDCANKQSIIRYLEEQTAGGKTWHQTQAQYEATYSNIRTKVWEIRTACQPLN